VAVILWRVGVARYMSFLAMLTPADGLAGVKRFVPDCVVRAGGKLWHRGSRG
jgi:hypothetical protein